MVCLDVIVIGFMSESEKQKGLWFLLVLACTFVVVVGD